jgi:hypothetical protein
MDNYIKAFISCSSQEKELGEVLRKWIEENSAGYISCFLSDIPMGENWKESLRRALREYDILISIMTEKYKSSQWAYVEWAPFWVNENKFVFVVVLDEELKEKLFKPMQDRQIPNIIDKDDLFKFIQALFDIVNRRASSIILTVLRQKIEDLSLKIKKIYKDSILKQFRRLSSVEDINEFCDLTIADAEVTPIVISDNNIVSISQDIANIIVETNENTIRITGYTEDAGTFKVDCGNKLYGKRFLLIKSKGTLKSESKSFDKLFKIVIETHVGKKFRTYVLIPYLDSQRNADDEQYVTKSDSYYIYDIEGLISKDDTIILEFVFWKIRIKDLRVSLYVV